MSLFTRLRNALTRQRLHNEIDEELADHIHHAIEAGRTREEAEQAFGSHLRHREASADLKLATWLDSLRADIIFGYRQLKRRPAATASAILSLALAIGAVTAAFRLIDAVLLRPLPVSDPSSLYTLSYAGLEVDAFSYPLYKKFTEALTAKADLFLLSYTTRNDITYSTENEMEKAYRQYVSGNHFSALGLQPALGRLIGDNDDRQPGAHPVAVLTHQYWTRRFARDPKVIGRTFRIGATLYEIIGVSPEGYTGTETGLMTDIFVPAMQNARAIPDPHWAWTRIWLRPKSGISLTQIQQQLQAAMTADRREAAKQWPADTPRERIDQFVNTELRINSASAGASETQKTYRRSLLILGAVVLLVLLIACANVANLLSAQAAARQKEMALRISIGAGRARLLQLLFIECLLLAITATILGAVFAAWSAPFVVQMINPPDDPLRLHMPADWRVLAFSAILALAVTILFGLAPATRACRVQPVSALKGGDDPHARRRLMNALVAAQVAFCFLVHFTAGLFVATFNRLSSQPTGFDANNVLTVETESRMYGKERTRPQQNWQHAADQLRSISGVEATAIAGWALMSGNGWTSTIRTAGQTHHANEPYFLGVSPGFFETMSIPLIDGREFNHTDKHPIVNEKDQPVEGVAIVNESFARAFFDGANPIGKTFERLDHKNIPVRTQIIGYVRDARYRDMREPIRPVAYSPLSGKDWATILVRTTGVTPDAIAAQIRKLVSQSQPDLRVTNIVPQSEIVRAHTIRERLLATLSLFFAILALILAAVGLYGVLNYSVLQRKRELGIRIALGARSTHVITQVASSVFFMLILGSAVGLTAGLAAEQLFRTLLFEVKATDPRLLITPFLTIFAAACLAAIPPVLTAARTDPATALRSE
ncbi:MAG: ABC transporter permease [Acidobacteria bacterium]|nr:ABC transporter permease [Acidobacteriota bacterium]